MKHLHQPAPGARRWAIVVVGLLALAAGPVTACGQDDGGDDGVAAVGDGPSDTSTSTGDDGAPAPTDPDEQILEFTQCLRENGLDVEDPAPGEGLRLQFGPETDQATVEAAMEACRELAPGGGPGGPGGPGVDPQAAIEHAECMRENGVDAFPDPSSDGQIMIGPEVAEDPDFESASEACDDLLGLAP